MQNSIIPRLEILTIKNQTWRIERVPIPYNRMSKEQMLRVIGAERSAVHLEPNTLVN